jgi:Mg-chelatase subunit ChlD
MAPPRRIPFIEGTWKGRTRRFRPDRFLVKLKDSVQASAVPDLLNAVLESVDGKGIPFRSKHVGVIQLAPGAEALSKIESLQGNQALADDIDWVEPDFRVRSLVGTATMPNDPLLTDPGDGSVWQWGMEPMGMAEAWARQRGSGSVVVVIVDNGFETGHPDLTSGRFLFGGSFLYIQNATGTFTPDGVFTDVMPANMQDLQGHGVGMAGVIAADCDNGTTVAGMNWASPIGICCSMDDGDRNEDGVAGSTSTVLAGVLQAITYAKNEGLHLVVNLSLEFTDDQLSAKFGSLDIETFRYMCEQARDAGALLVCAGGNTGKTALVSPAVYATEPEFQATVLAVGFTCLPDVAPGKPVLASGEYVSTRSHQGVTVVAPGYDWPLLRLNGADPQEEWGSSIAAAHVSGLASLIWSHRPDLTATDVIEVIKDTAELPADPDVMLWGAGRVNAYEALRAVEKRPVISLVADTSGSMAGSSGTPGVTRMQVLQGAADILLHVTEGDSHVGVVQFSSAAAVVVTPTGIDPANPAATQDNLSVRVAALTSSGATSIGAGVLAGVTQVQGVADGDVTGEASRAVILMTDGRENAGPRVNPGPGDPAVDLSVLAATGIPVYSVGTGDTSAVDVDALKTLAETTGGEYAVTGPWSADSEQTIAKFFCQVLAETAGYTSLLDPSGVLTKAGGEELVDFGVTRDEQRIEVILMKPEGVPMRLALEAPDGQEIDASTAAPIGGVEYRVSDRVIVMRLMLPCVASGGESTHAGRWRAAFRVTDGPENREVPYTLIVNARSRISMEARVKQDDRKPGATASVIATLLRDGKPFAVRNLDANLTVQQPDGSQAEAKLEKARGRLAGKVRLPLEGAYRLALRVAGKVDGSSFVREKVLTAATWAQAEDPGDRKV